MFEVKVEGADKLIEKLDLMRKRVKELHTAVPQMSEQLEQPESDSDAQAEVAISGRDATTADLISNIKRGVDLHPSIIRLAAKFIVSGRTYNQTVAILYRLLDASSAPHDARWAKRRKDIPRSVLTAMKFTVHPRHKRRRKRQLVSGSITVPAQLEGTEDVKQAVGQDLITMAREAMQWP